MIQEMYKDGLYRVAFSPEEKDQLIKKGWSDEKEPGVEYVVHTAVGASDPAKQSASDLAKARDKAAVQDDAESVRKAAEAKAAAQNDPGHKNW